VTNPGKYCDEGEKVFIDLLRKRARSNDDGEGGGVAANEGKKSWQECH